MLFSQNQIIAVAKLGGGKAFFRRNALRTKFLAVLLRIHDGNVVFFELRHIEQSQGLREK